MKIIITEEQEKTILHTILDDLFQGYKIKFIGNGRYVFVDGEVIAILKPTSCEISNKILKKIQEQLYYDDMKTFKESVGEWVSDTFGVKKAGGFRYGVSFKNFETNKLEKSRIMDKDFIGVKNDPDFDVKAFKERVKQKNDEKIRKELSKKNG